MFFIFSSIQNPKIGKFLDIRIFCRINWVRTHLLIITVARSIHTATLALLKRKYVKSMVKWYKFQLNIPERFLCNDVIHTENDMCAFACADADIACWSSFFPFDLLVSKHVLKNSRIPIPVPKNVFIYRKLLLLMVFQDPSSTYSGRRWNSQPYKEARSVWLRRLIAIPTVHPRTQGGKTILSFRELLSPKYSWFHWFRSFSIYFANFTKSRTRNCHQTNTGRMCVSQMT